MNIPPMIDPLAKVDHSVQFGTDVVIWAFSSVHAGAVLEDYVSVGERVYIGRGARIGTRTRISQGAHIEHMMLVGRNVFIGPGVIFCSDKHPIANNPRWVRKSPEVKDDVSIGAGAIILPGVLLGEGCMIGAGSIVTRDVAPHTTVYGNPARVMPVTLEG